MKEWLLVIKKVTWL